MVPCRSKQIKLSTRRGSCSVSQPPRKMAQKPRSKPVNSILESMNIVSTSPEMDPLFDDWTDLRIEKVGQAQSTSTSYCSSSSISYIEDDQQQQQPAFPFPLLQSPATNQPLGQPKYPSISTNDEGKKREQSFNQSLAKFKKLVPPSSSALASHERRFRKCTEQPNLSSFSNHQSYQQQPKLAPTFVPYEEDQPSSNQFEQQSPPSTIFRHPLSHQQQPSSSATHLRPIQKSTSPVTTEEESEAISQQAAKPVQKNKRFNWTVHLSIMLCKFIVDRNPFSEPKKSANLIKIWDKIFHLLNIEFKKVGLDQLPYKSIMAHEIMLRPIKNTRLHI